MKRFIFLYPVILSSSWAAVIFVLCATPGKYIPSADWMELLSLDKLVHASVFFILSFLLIVVAVKNNQGQTFIILYSLLSVFYGMLMEFMQSEYFSDRSADWMDVIANSFGCFIALLLSRKIRQWFSLPLT